MTVVGVGWSSHRIRCLLWPGGFCRVWRRIGAVVKLWLLFWFFPSSDVTVVASHFPFPLLLCASSVVWEQSPVVCRARYIAGSHKRTHGGEKRKKSVTVETLNVREYVRESRRCANKNPPINRRPTPTQHKKRGTFHDWVNLFFLDQLLMIVCVCVCVS